jgi:N-acetylneuraminate synthase
MTELVAEISGSHGGDLNNALRLITEAKAAGADAVKFQTFLPERLAEKRAKNPRVVALAKDFHGRSLLDLYRQTHTPREWFPDLIARAYRERISWFSSVFDPDDVAFLETLDCPRYKISAFEMLDGDLINAVVATGKPIVMSVRPTPGVTILRATEYDGSADCGLGVSDHSKDMRFISHRCPMVERHLRLPDVPCHDSEFSSTPDEFREYVKAIRAMK